MSVAAVDPGPSLRRATGLLQRLDLAPGGRLLTVLPDSPAALAVGLACQLAGVVQVPLHRSVTTRELDEIIADAEPAAALLSPDGPVPTVELPIHRLDLAEERPVEPAARWPLTRPMAYTSGTTGRRKGVHVGVHDEAWGEATVTDEHDAFDRRHGDVHLVVSPLHHSGPSRFASVTAFLGGRVAVLPGFDARRFVTALREIRPASLFCVPTHLQRLLALPEVGADDLASLQLLAHAGAPCPRSLKERVLELAPEGSVWEFYGATEGQFTVCPPDEWRAAPGTVGRARPGRRLEVRDDGGRALPAGAVGTVWVHAPDHARWEYWRDPERTAAAWDGEAFTVGDLGRVDGGGRLRLEGRPGDLVITGGVNVYPAEVERRLLDHPHVAEAVAFGVPDAEWGERLVAAVVARPGTAPRPDDVRRHARAGLQLAAVPKQVLVVAELPRTSTGKVRRTGLVEWFDLRGSGPDG